MLMLKIQDLRVSYGDMQILNSIDLHLEPGDTLSLVGESGAGKTTLGLAIIGLSEGMVSGRVVFKGEDLLKISEERLRDLRGNEIVMVFQNVEDALDQVYKVEDQVAEAISVHRTWNREKVSQRVIALLQAVGLNTDKATSYPHQLSGGEKQRAMIAMALANDPKVLILDEPTASLDSVTKTEIIELLRSATAGKITLVITHDISTASKLSEKMAVLYAGKIVEMGRTEDLVANPRHPYTRGLMRSYPNMTTTKDLQGIPGRMAYGIKGCPFHERCAQKIKICSLEKPDLKEAEDGWMIACHRGGIVPLLQIRGISKSFGFRSVLDDIHLTLYEGETLALIGESGSGKTTLAKIIMGLHDSDSGEILVEETRVQRRDLGFYRIVQMIFQNPKESLSHRMNVLQLAKEPLDIHKLSRPEDRASRVKAALESVELPER